MTCRCFLAVLIALPLLGQYPGQYPGRYPGGTGIPMPRRGRQGKSSDSKSQNQVPVSTTGMLRSIADKSILLEADDSRIIKFQRNEKTKFLKDTQEEMKASDLKPGDHVLIEATQDDEGFQYAVSVTLQKRGTEAERAAAALPVDTGEASTQEPQRGDDDRPVLRRKGDQPKPAEAEKKPATPVAEADAADVDNNPTTVMTPPPIREADDQGPPELKRGKPARRSTPAASAPEPVLTADARRAEPAALPKPVVTKPDLLIVRAREAAGTYGESLPNYIAQQFTARFVSVTHTPSWQPQDVVSAEVIYENGRERYRNLAVNGKGTKKSMEELGGAWSTGEFGTVLLDLFSPATAADFRRRQDASIAGRPAVVYDFTVNQPHSHWIVKVPSQSVRPAYAGTIWVDKDTAHVLRIEMQARRMPSAFPLDTVESAVDYQFVRIAAREYLLPVRAETLSCIRGTNNCSKNQIDFRNYHKYVGESTIVFDK